MSDPSSWQRLLRQYRASMKSMETEDRIDLLFYRPLGFLLAKLAELLRLTPTQLTLGGMLTGVYAGFLFADPSRSNLILASLLFLLSGILDSSDGQLARITGKSSPFGLVLDGLCDNLVFISVYVGCVLTLIPQYTHWIWPLAVAAGASHSTQSALLDFHLREYLFFTSGNESYWNPDLEQAQSELAREPSPSARFFQKLRISWICQQQFLSPRSAGFRQRLRARLLSGSPGSPERAAFVQELRRHQLHTLSFWRPLGANLHTLGIIACAWAGHFEWYLVGVDLVGMNVWLGVAWLAQRRADRKLALALGLPHSERLAEAR